MNRTDEAGFGWRELERLARLLARFLDPEHKRGLLQVSAWAVCLSFMELLLAAAIVPYIQCLTGQCLPRLDSVAATAGWSPVALMTATVFALLVLKLSCQATFAWRAAAFSQRVQRDAVSRLLNAYLHQDWATFRSRHRADYFRRCATTAVDAAHVSHQCVTMIASALVMTFLLGLMLWQYPLASLSLIVGFGLVNAVTQRWTGGVQRLAAVAREGALRRWNIGMAEAFASFREIRVYGLERYVLEHIDRSLDTLAAANRKIDFIPILPRLVLDFCAIGLVLLAVLLWLLFERPMTELVPMLIFYAVVARSVLPAMINLLSTRSVLRGSIVNVELLLGELEAATQVRKARIGVPVTEAEPPRFLMQGVGFRHAQGSPAILDGVDLEILHPSWVAIVGASGAGKSTVMELLCGIHAPETGRVVHEWPRDAESSPLRIAYVPQHVALIDDTVQENVVFGFDEGDPARVRRVLSLANLDEVVAGLEGGCTARVGADGARLSGGERQRLALARALYRQPHLLLLDEATSGLDEATEMRVLAGLREGCPRMSVVFVTHRAGNLRFADRVVRLEGGILCDVSAGS